MKNEPVLLTNLAGVLVVLAARFGLDLSTDEVVTVLAAVTVVATVVSRRKVTPVAKTSQPEVVVTHEGRVSDGV